MTGAGAKFTGYLFSPDDNDGRGKGLFNDFDDFGAPSSGPFGEDEEREVEVDG